jgi:ribosome-binding protein aMBF1 (putative translation factor)
MNDKKSKNEEFAEFVMNMKQAAGWNTGDLAHHMCLSVTSAEAYQRGEKLPPDPAKFEQHLRSEVKLAIQRLREIRYTIAV